MWNVEQQVVGEPQKMRLTSNRCLPCLLLLLWVNVRRECLVQCVEDCILVLEDWIV